MIYFELGWLGFGKLAIDITSIINLNAISDKGSISDEGVIRIKIPIPNMIAQIKVENDL